MSVLETAGACAFLGLASTLHCAGMCGPLAVRGCSSASNPSLRLTVGYLLGRTTSYLFLGAVAGTIGSQALASLGSPVRVVVAEAVALLLLVEGVRMLSPRVAVRVRALPLAAMRPLVRLVPREGLGLGLATGFLPCGALLSALVLASGSGNVAGAMLGMVVFSLASLPGLVLPLAAARGLGAARGGWQLRRRLAGGGGIALILLALWVGARPLMTRAHWHACADLPALTSAPTPIDDVSTTSDLAGAMPAAEVAVHAPKE